MESGKGVKAMEINLQYPLKEKIGNPYLPAGREKEFSNFRKWIENIPGMLSKSRVILARRKSGKTSFIQRLFNELWSAGGEVIPFYFDIVENEVWYPAFAVRYYCHFASQYIAFLERNPDMVLKPLTLEEIRQYGVSRSLEPLVSDVSSLLDDAQKKYHEFH